jgi:NADH-quinone oxidoreductase subunit L
MSWIVENLWLIPALPVVAAGVIAVLKQAQRRLASGLAIGSMVMSLALSLMAFVEALGLSGRGEQAREVFNVPWFQIGAEWFKVGWVLDPLTAVMLVMVTFVGALIFIYSVGYMAHDENFTRFFCFLSLFAGAMLGVVIANSLLLLFICWELVGLTSFLLIGFWYQKPSAASAAKKAFITTRIGDLAFLLGMVWLNSEAGTLLFYDNGAGCMEHSALVALAAKTTVVGLAASTGIALLIFGGAMGKSGQVPLHVWLPDAMEGPTPVSALIHAATMVAAGVFLIARVYPLMSASAQALSVVAWVGAFTAVFAASIAVA